MKRLFLVSITLSLVFVSSAQIQVGAKAGLNLANLSAPAAFNDIYHIKPRFNAGGLVSFPLMGKFSLQPEIMYSGAGSKYKEPDSDTSNFNLGYINVPVLLKYTTSFGLFAEAGPQIGFLISAKRDHFGSFGTNSNRYTEDIKDEYNSTDFSAVFGIGYLSRFNLGIDARYNLGLTNTLKNSNTMFSYSLKNKVIQIGLFYVVGKRKK